MSANELRPFELMQKMANFLESESVKYRVVGSMASIAYGEPRFTNDVDMLVDLLLANIDAIHATFPAPEYYVSSTAVRDAVLQRRQFNILHIPSGLKIDVIIAKNTEFGRADLSHGRRLKNEGFYDAWFATPENVILKKRVYFREGGSEKHLRDIAGVLQVQGAKIDQTYLDEWAVKLGVSEELEWVRERLRQV